MNRRIFVLFLFVFIVRCSAQSPDNLQECRERVQAAEAKVQEWQDWRDRNMPKYNEITANYETLEKRNTELEDERPYFLAAAFGVGLFIVFAIGKGIRRAWPLGSERRRLVLMLLVASWISLAFFGAHANGDSDWSSDAFVYSLPALLFGGVLFWWFGKSLTPPKVFVASEKEYIDPDFPDPDELEARQTPESDRAPDWWGRKKDEDGK